MATKKSQSKAKTQPAATPPAETSSSPVTIWKWMYVGGGLIAALAGAFSFENQILTWALTLAAVLAGWFHGDIDDITNTGIRYLLLGAVYAALDFVPVIGPIITGFVGGFFAFLGPMMLALLIKWFWNVVASRMI